MADIPVRYDGDTVVLSHFAQDLLVSVATTTAVHHDNAKTRSVSTPRPCFEFDAKIPGKMSGAPILGGDGAVIRGKRVFSWFHDVLDPNLRDAAIGPRGWPSCYCFSPVDVLTTAGVVQRPSSNAGLGR